MRSLPSFSSLFYKNSVLDKYASQPTHPLSLRQLVVFAKNLSDARLLQSANYVQKELCIRLAHRIRDFQSLPFILVTNEHFQDIHKLYWTAFERLSRIKIKTFRNNDELVRSLRELLEDHKKVIPKLAMGLAECDGILEKERLDQFMFDMLKTRISRRVIAEQHIALSTNGRHSPGNYGIVSTVCDARKTVEKCVDYLKGINQHLHGDCGPKVLIHGEQNLIFTHIPSHIEYVLMELLKNASVASINAGSDITVTLVQNEHELIFRISDKGGGMENETEKNLFSYKTSSRMSLRATPEVTGCLNESISTEIGPRKLGLGLIMSKVYATYWDGQLEVVNVPGYGVDTYLFVSRLGNRSE